MSGCEGFVFAKSYIEEIILMMMLSKALKENFGFDRFRKNQEAIIENLLEGKDTVVIMPTGIGKSLCYQLPALVQDGLTIVISPLIALMKDQVDFLTGKGIRATLLNSTISKTEMEDVKAQLINKDIKILYISPESFNKKENIFFFKKLEISFIAVDEAHCISSWGHDFRPEYRKIKESINELPALPIIALTATATKKVELDIINTLDIHDAAVFRSSFDRPNLYYEVTGNDLRDKHIVQYVKKKGDEAGIIYCQHKKKVEELTLLLRNNGIKAGGYHASLKKSVRVGNQEKFLKNEISVIVATIAFGMGVDKPNVRFIIHYNCPKSIENYYQETGRAGRDGKNSQCVLYYDERDIVKLRRFNTNKPISVKRNANLALEAMTDFAISSVCRRKQLLYYFDEIYQKDRCGYCDNCDSPAARYEGKNLLFLLLSTIQKTDEKLPTEHIIHLICGIKDDDIASYGHEELPNFGAGKDHSVTIWRSIIRQALLGNYIVKDTIHEEDILKITAQGVAFMSSPVSVEFYQDRVYNEEELLAKKVVSKPVIHDVLLKKLYEVRAQEAKKKQLRPYVIFEESIVKDMATSLPSTLQELAYLSGVGINKARKFGEPFVACIKRYVEEHNLAPSDHVVVKSNRDNFAKKIHLIQQIDKKVDLEDIAKMNDLTQEEVIKALEEICYTGVKININYYVDSLLDKDDQEELYNYFYERETDNIEQAIEELRDDFSEEEIRIMHIKFLSDVAY